jgi:sugar phosphate isomerase/epimerase
MSGMSRRELLRMAAQDAAAAGLLAAGAREMGAVPMGIPIGSQTYPHRKRIQEGDFAGLCRDMAEIGVGNLELCSTAYAEFAVLSNGKQTRKILEDHGLKCPSGHFEMSELSNRHEQAIEWAKEVGMTQMGTASLGAPSGHGAAGFEGMDGDHITMDVVKRAAGAYNKIGEVAAKAGIQQFLHNEGFEQSQVDGRLTYQVLLELLDPKLVKMQFQMSSMRVVGDPVMYFQKYPGHWLSLHLQGVNLDPPTPGAGRGGRGPGLAVGRDKVDWAKVFTAAKAVGVKNYFVEQNWDLTVESVKYLKTFQA